MQAQGGTHSTTTTTIQVCLAVMFRLCMRIYHPTWFTYQITRAACGTTGWKEWTFIMEI